MRMKMNEPIEETTTISLEELMGMANPRLDKSKKINILVEAIQLLVNLKTKIFVNGEIGNIEYLVIEDASNREAIELWIMELSQLLKEETKSLFKTKKK